MAKSNRDPNAENWTMQTVIPKIGNSGEETDYFIATTYAQPVTLTLQPNGDWDAVIVAASYGYCFPFKTFNGSVFTGSFEESDNATNGENDNATLNLGRKARSALEYLVDTAYTLYEINSFPTASCKFPSDLWEPNFTADSPLGYRALPTNWTNWYDFFGANIEYPEVETGVDNSSAWMKALKYFVDKLRFKYYRWFPMMFNAVRIVKVHNGEVAATIYANSGGGHEDYSPNWNENKWSVEYFNDFVIEGDKEENDWEFPFDEKYYFKARGLRLTEIYRKKTNDISEKIVELKENLGAAIFPFFEAYRKFPMKAMHENYTKDKREEYDNTIRLVRPYCLPEVMASYDVVYQNSTDEVQHGTPAVDFDYLDGWFKFGETAETADDNEVLSFHHCFAELGKEFLLGTYGGRLCKFDKDGNFEIVAEGLKNFRLRKMKNVNKARG